MFERLKYVYDANITSDNHNLRKKSCNQQKLNSEKNRLNLSKD